MQLIVAGNGLGGRRSFDVLLPDAVDGGPLVMSDQICLARWPIVFSNVIQVRFIGLCGGGPVLSQSLARKWSGMRRAIRLWGNVEIGMTKAVSPFILEGVERVRRVFW